MMIVMTNTKGGVGKSTLTAHLAIWLFDHGRKVALLDADEQATAAGWIERAEKRVTVAKATTVDAIRREWKKLRSSHEFIVADSPGSGREVAQAITLRANAAFQRRRRRRPERPTPSGRSRLAAATPLRRRSEQAPSAGRREIQARRLCRRRPGRSLRAPLNFRGRGDAATPFDFQTNARSRRMTPPTGTGMCRPGNSIEPMQECEYSWTGGSA